MHMTVGSVPSGPTRENVTEIQSSCWMVVRKLADYVVIKSPKLVGYAYFVSQFDGSHVWQLIGYEHVI